MKVCHMTSAHKSNDVRIFVKECSSLAAAGYEVYLVAAGENREENGVHVIGIGEAPKSRKDRMTTFAKQIYEKALALNCDVYHFHDPELLPYGLKLKRHGKKVIFDSHENTAESILEKSWIKPFIRKAAHKIYYDYQYYVVNRLDAVIYVTPNVKEYFEKLNKKAVLITNYPIVTNDYKKPCFETKKLCFAGGISEQWSHRELINALVEFPNLRYVLCGKADKEYFDELQKLPGWSQVEFLGVLPHEEIANVMTDCFAGVALLKPSHNSDWKKGTLGNTKIFEEMMAGLPILCTDFECWKEFVDKYKCGIYVDVNKQDSIINGLKKLQELSISEAQNMGNGGRRAVINEFNWEIENKKLLSLYCSLQQ